MPDTDDTSKTGQTADDTDDQRDAGTSQTSGNQRDADDGADHDSDESTLPEGVRRTLANLRQFERESKRLQRELTAANAKLKERDDADKSESEKLREERDALKAERAEWQRQRRDLNLRHETENAARDAGFADPADVYRFLDVASVDFDDDDRPAGIKDAVKELAKAKPYLLAKAQNGAANGPPPTPKSDRAANTLTPDEDKQAKSLFATHTMRSF